MEQLKITELRRKPTHSRKRQKCYLCPFPETAGLLTVAATARKDVAVNAKLSKYLMQCITSKQYFVADFACCAYSFGGFGCLLCSQFATKNLLLFQSLQKSPPIVVWRQQEFQMRFTSHEKRLWFQWHLIVAVFWRLKLRTHRKIGWNVVIWSFRARRQ